ncbi:MAG TPA: TolC family protein [Candidatus Binataceae bacterium]|nr:TolC family protein [Candidatus Binataceae bacterium]
MSSRKRLLLTLTILSIIFAGGTMAPADDSLKVTGALPTSPLPAPATSGTIQLNAQPIAPQQAPPENLSPSVLTAPFEQRDSALDLPAIFGHQWSLTKESAPESLISERYLRSQDSNARGVTLKESIYIALRNNPGLQASALDPIASMESVRQANGAFDPNITSQGDIIKNVQPTTNILQTGNHVETYTQKNYDWNFGINKVSSITNGTWGVTFNNDRSLSNSSFAGVNPSYTPTLALSLSQPLLQNFGWKFATINVRIAESGQRQAQWNFGQTLQDFVERIGGEYWNVVLAEENLDVARAALRFNQDLVRQNAISVKVGTLAPIDLQEAQSAAATAEANVFTAEANLKNTRSQLREDVMFNPYGTFLPAELEPITRPAPEEKMTMDENRALELAVQYRPSLAGMREAIRGALMQEKFSENQVLPQLNLGTQFGINSTAGTTPCLSTSSAVGNCTPLGGGTGSQLPFGGIYGDALNRLWGFSFYNYAAVLTFQVPLDNATARAALSQARIQYEQQRAQYRAALAQAVVDVQSALSNLYADQKRATATAQATYYARQSLHDEEVRFRVGLATTHDLLQFQEEEVSAEGNQVQAEVDLENAKLAMGHATGTLLQSFQIDFDVKDPHDTPWYAAF